jgi:tetratricopeptide (TPR) repeat protein
VWNFDAAGRPLTVFNSDKIHARWGYRWRNPCHEVLAWVGEGSEVFGAVAGSPLIEHHADDGKRRDYLDLLKQATKENPEDDRAAHYYARELMYQGWYTQATEEFDRHLKLRSATWGPERAASWRYIARCWVQRSIPLASYAAAEAALLQATREDTNARESWLELAELMASRDDWAGAMWAVRRCLAITERTGHYITDMRAWDGTPEKLLVVCCKKLGDLRAQAYAGMQELARARA